MRHARWWSVIAFAVVLAGCSSAPDPSHPNAVPEYIEPTPAPLTAVTSPQRFDTDRPIMLPATATTSNTTLHRATAFINTPDGVIVYDTNRIGASTVVHAGHPKASPDQDELRYRKPLAAAVDGKTRMIVPVPVSLPGQGTTLATPAVDVLVIDAETGALASTFTVPVPASTGFRGITQAVAVVEGDLIFTHGWRTIRISLTDGSVRWTLDDFQAVTLSGSGNDRLIGSAYVEPQEHARAIDPITTATIWTDPTGGGLELTIQPGGLHYVIASRIRLLDADTGEVADASSTLRKNAPKCTYDQLATIICSSEGWNPWTGALDADTGTWLWQLPDATANRSGITMTTAWRGLAYGTTSNGPVVLDARTGQDREPAADAAPVMVNEYLGVSESGRQMTTYPTRP